MSVYWVVLIHKKMYCVSRNKNKNKFGSKLPNNSVVVERGGRQISYKEW